MSASVNFDLSLEFARYRALNRFQRQDYEEAGRRLSPQEAIFFVDDPQPLRDAVVRCLRRRLSLARAGGKVMVLP